MQSMKVLSKLAREGFSLDFFVCSNHHERRRPHYGLGKFLLLALNHAHRNIGQFPYSSRAIPKHQLLAGPARGVLGQLILGFLKGHGLSTSEQLPTTGDRANITTTNKNT